MAQIYIPYTEATGKYIGLNHLLSYYSKGIRIFIVIGARGYGKTFKFKRLCVKDFVFKNGHFIVLRDTIDACDKICEQEGHKFFDDVMSFGALTKHKAMIKGIEDRTILIDDKRAGEVMPLSAYYKYKGNYYDIKNLFFDEFIAEKQQAYRGNRARQFANTIETTIRRNPNTRVLMTANALDKGNDILELLGFNIKDFGYYINYEKKAILYYAPNSPEFEADKQQSLSGIITAGTFLDESMNQNRFEDDGIIFEKRGPCDIYGIYHNFDNEAVRLYKHKTKDIYYACKDINPHSYDYMRYVFDYNQVTGSRHYADKNVKMFLQRLVAAKKIQYESKYIMSVFMSIINNRKKN
ncbi:MAG: phage DNA encapsidation protein [Methanobrevibacter sp.]|nr:phage DNA encapsidation protein [Methanobrevibacter sp.]